jgi:hypothetical protein
MLVDALLYLDQFVHVYLVSYIFILNEIGLPIQWIYVFLFLYVFIFVCMYSFFLLCLYIFVCMHVFVCMLCSSKNLFIFKIGAFLILLLFSFTIFTQHTNCSFVSLASCSQYTKWSLISSFNILSIFICQFVFLNVRSKIGVYSRRFEQKS